MDGLERYLLQAMGIGAVAATGCRGYLDGQETGETADTADTADTVDTVETGLEPTCEEVPRLEYGAGQDWHWQDDPGLYLVCDALPDDGSDCPPLDAISPWSLLNEAAGPVSEPDFCGWHGTAVCGPEATIADACCYVLDVTVVCEGRPLTAAEGTRRAPVVESDGWRGAFELSEVPLPLRAALGEAFAETGRDEHASVGSFARFVLELLHLGAPSELVAEAQRAMADEIRHARDAFGIASALAGRTLGPGPLPTGGELLRTDVVAIVVGAVREGCIGETIAAARAGVAASGCRVPEIRAVLAQVAADEARHAALAWRFVRWALDAFPEVREPVAEALAATVGPPPVEEEPDLRGYGRLSRREQHDVAVRVLRDVVRPCAEALYSTWPSTKAASSRYCSAPRHSPSNSKMS